MSEVSVTICTTRVNRFTPVKSSYTYQHPQCDNEKESLFFSQIIEKNWKVALALAFDQLHAARRGYQ